MYKYSILLSLAFVLGITSPALASEHNAGESCTITQLGTTEMNATQTGIIGCFREQAGGTTYAWKSFVGANNENTSLCYTIKYKSPTVIGFSDPAPTSLAVSSIASGAKYTSQAAVIAAFPHYSAAGTSEPPYSGIKCLNGYSRTACTLSTGGSDNDVAATDNGCVIDNEETTNLSAANGGLYITCCK